jgi:hypothetical protein
MAATPAAVHELDRDVVLPPPNTHIRRGACAHDHELSCSNAGTPGFPEMCPDADRCRGFSLIAGKAAP